MIDQFESFAGAADWDGQRKKRKLESTTSAVGPPSAKANNSSLSQVTLK